MTGAALQSPQELAALVEEMGFLPFFRNNVPGFSLEERVDARYWFPDEGEGAWEWKGPVIRLCDCAYGKFFRGKAGYISKAWFADFANYRRCGYDLDALYDDGYAKRSDMELWTLLNQHGALLTDEWKRLGCYCKGGNKGFECKATRLQMQGYVLISDFPYRVDKHGKPYGWGVARYETPEARYGEAFREAVYQRTPEESRERMLAHLRRFTGESRALEALLDGGRVNLSTSSNG